MSFHCARVCLLRLVSYELLSRDTPQVITVSDAFVVYYPRYF